MVETEENGVPVYILDEAPTVTYPRMSIGALVAELEFISERMSNLAGRKARLMDLIQALSGDFE